MCLDRVLTHSTTLVWPSRSIVPHLTSEPKLTSGSKNKIFNSEFRFSKILRLLTISKAHLTLDLWFRPSSNLLFFSESRFPKIKSDSRVGYCFESDQPDSSWFLSFESNCKAAVLNCGDDLNCAYQHMKSYENNNCKGTVFNFFITSWSRWRPDEGFNRRPLKSFWGDKNYFRWDAVWILTINEGWKKAKLHQKSNRRRGKFFQNFKSTNWLFWILPFRTIEMKRA